MAFRKEPFTTFFDCVQALALYDKTIDNFIVEIDTQKLEEGATERYIPGSGYHVRIFESTENISKEEGTWGLFQNYGVFVPSSYKEDTLSPLTLYLHGSGSPVHCEPLVLPRILKDLGEDRDSIIIAPSGRHADLSMYAGAGHVDVLQAYEDAHKIFTIDPTRTYVAGYSMGGWGAYMMSVLYPDRFAAAFAIAGSFMAAGFPTGLNPDDNESLQWLVDINKEYGYGPYYLFWVHGIDNPLKWDLRPQFSNLLHVPLVIYQGALDTTIVMPSALYSAKELRERELQHRLYLFPIAEHLTYGVVDEWKEAANYLDKFRLNPNPAEVTYIRNMVLEKSIERGNAEPDGPPCPCGDLDFSFDGAYWVDGLTPADLEDGIASINARSFALPYEPTVTKEEVGGPTSIGQIWPWIMTGISWEKDSKATQGQLTNSFKATINGAESVILDLVRMSIKTDEKITGIVETDHDLSLLLSGLWSKTPNVSVNGEPASSTFDGNIMEIELEEGSNEVVIDPSNTTEDGKSGICFISTALN